MLQYVKKIFHFYLQTINVFINQAKTPAKRGRPARSTPGRRKKAKIANEDDDDEEEEVLPKKDRGAKSKPGTPAAKGRGRAAKGKSKKEVEPEEEIEEEEEEEENFDEDDDVEDEDVDEDEEEDIDEEEEEEELNQGPNAKPAKKFTVCIFNNKYITQKITQLAKCMIVNCSLEHLLFLKLI